MKADGPNFDREWRAACSIRPVSVGDLTSFTKAHYLRRRPAIVMLALAMMKGERPLGMAVFAEPPLATKKRYGGETWELARLYILDEVPRNAETWLIAKSIKHIRRHHPAVKVLVSYADPSVGHEGTIYKAANWIADGRTDDERKTPRADYVGEGDALGGGKRYRRRAHIPEGALVSRVPRVSKHRFIYRLDRIA